MKITIIEKRKYAFPKEDGTMNMGYAYGGFNASEEPMTFSSKKDYPAYPELISYDPQKAIDVKLTARFWDGKVKYQELP